MLTAKNFQICLLTGCFVLLQIARANAYDCASEPLAFPAGQVTEYAAAEPWGPGGTMAVAVPAEGGGYHLYYQVSANEYCPVLTSPPALQIRILEACPDGEQRELPCIEAVHVPWRGQSNTRALPYGGGYVGTFVTYAPDVGGRYTVELRSNKVEFDGPELDELVERGDLPRGRVLVRDFENSSWSRDYPLRQPMNRTPFKAAVRAGQDGREDLAAGRLAVKGPLPAGALAADQLRAIWGDNSYAVYLVLEGAGKRDMRKFLSEEMQVDPFFLRLLYKGYSGFDTPELLSVSPCVVKVKATDKLWQWYLEEGAWTGEGVIILGPKNSDAMDSHLRKLIESHLPGKRRTLVRFYDPFPMQFLAPVLKDKANFKGPMTNLLYPAQFGGYFYLVWDKAEQADKIETSGMTPPILELTEVELAAVTRDWNDGPLTQLREWLAWAVPDAPEDLAGRSLDLCNLYDQKRYAASGDEGDLNSTQRTTAPRDVALMLHRTGGISAEAEAVLLDTGLDNKERAARLAALSK